MLISATQPVSHFSRAYCGDPGNQMPINWMDYDKGYVAAVRDEIPPDTRSGFLGYTDHAEYTGTHCAHPDVIRRMQAYEIWKRLPYDIQTARPHVRTVWSFFI